MTPLQLLEWAGAAFVASAVALVVTVTVLFIVHLARGGTS